MKLNDLIAEFHEIEDLIIMGNGEITPEIEERLSFNKEEFSSKLDKYENLKRYLKGQVEYLKTQEERFNRRRKTISNTIKWLSECQAFSMVQTDRERLKTADYSFHIRETEYIDIDYDRIDVIDKSVLISSGLADEVLKVNKTEVKKYYIDKEEIPEWLKFKKKWSIFAK